jgi:hypothetical protein
MIADQISLVKSSGKTAVMSTSLTASAKARWARLPIPPIAAIHASWDQLGACQTDSANRNVTGVVNNMA